MSKEELRKRGVKYRNSMVMEIEKFFTKRILIQESHNKFIVVRINLELFSNKFDKIMQMEFPTF
jgi:hypothetical protein